MPFIDLLIWFYLQMFLFKTTFILINVKGDISRPNCWSGEKVKYDEKLYIERKISQQLHEKCKEYIYIVLAKTVDLMTVSEEMANMTCKIKVDVYSHKSLQWFGITKSMLLKIIEGVIKMWMKEIFTVFKWYYDSPQFTCMYLRYVLERLQLWIFHLLSIIYNHFR